MPKAKWDAAAARLPSRLAYGYREMGERVTDSLALAALRHAASLTQPNAPELAQRLYRYNRYPLSPTLRRAFPHAHAVLRYLLSEHTGELASLLDKQWSQTPSRDRFWTCLCRTVRVKRPPGLSFKLYVSPTLDATPQAFLDTVQALPHSGATRLKVARRVETLVRPDKLVLYFDTLEETDAMAYELRSRLDQLPAQGVPFGCRFDVAAPGMVSWGIDLPPQSVGEALSWRGWITKELAIALNRSESCNIEEQVDAALEHVRRKGVDPTCWRPNIEAWLKHLGDTDD